jgi:hypothetical protein
MDIAWTIAELCGAPDARAARSPLVGRSLLAEADPARAVYFSTWLGDTRLGRILGTDKVTYDAVFGTWGRFDLARDPREQHDLATTLDEGARQDLARELLGAKWNVDDFYRMGDQAEVRAMRRDQLPEHGAPIGVTFDGCIRLVRAHVDAEVDANRWLPAQLMFEVLARSGRDLVLEFDVRQGEQTRRAQIPRDPNRFPVAQWRAGDRIVLPISVYCGEFWASAGEACLQLSVVDADTEERITPVPDAESAAKARDGAVMVGRFRVRGNR